MKKFLIDIACTTLLFSAITIAVEPLFNQADNDYSFKYRQLREQRENVEYLLLGNSLFANSFNPHELGEKALCVASQSRSLNYDAAILREHISAMPNLKAVLLPMSGHLFAIGKDNDPYVRFFHTRYFHLPAADCATDWSALLTGQLRLGTLRDRHGCDSAGFAPVNRHWDGLCHPFVHPKTDVTLKNQPHYTRHLMEMAKLCAERGVRLIVVTPPATQVYEQNLSDTILRAMHEVVESVSMHVHMEYRSYFGDPQFKDDSLYADDLHLNQTGATLFARRVKEDFGL